MNNNLANILKTHLTTSSQNVIKVTSNDGIKLVKNSNFQRFAFTYADILQKYQSIEHFLKELATKGFSQATFTLQKIYTKNGKTTYHTTQKITHDLTQIMTQKSQTQHTQQLNFLSSPQIMQKMIEAERANDYKGTIDTLKETIKDLKSENRSLHEEKRALKIQVETSKQREELNLEKSKLEQKSFFESPAFEKTMEALGGIVPQVLSIVNSKTTPQALASPNTTISPVKKAFIQKVSSDAITDQQLLFFNYIIDNWSEQLITKVAQLIEQN